MSYSQEKNSSWGWKTLAGVCATLLPYQERGSQPPEPSHCWWTVLSWVASLPQGREGSGDARNTTHELLAGLICAQRRCLETDALGPKLLKHVTFWKYGHQGNYTNYTWHIMLQTVLHLVLMLDKINLKVFNNVTDHRREGAFRCYCNLCFPDYILVRWHRNSISKSSFYDSAWFNFVT